MKNIIHEEFDQKGNLVACMFDHEEIIRTSCGDLIPSHDSDYSIRKRYRNACEFYENGVISNIYLNDRTLVDTPIGKMDAELITFYEDGSIKRLFPLYGKLSAFWGEDDEFTLCREVEIPVADKKIKCHPRCIFFYPSGKVKSITIWPQTTISFMTRYGEVKTNLGASFYESGELESIEPSADTVVFINEKKIIPFYPFSSRIHADNCSLRFYKNGSIQALKAKTFKTLNNGGEDYEKRDFA